LVLDVGRLTILALLLLLVGLEAICLLVVLASDRGLVHSVLVVPESFGERIAVDFELRDVRVLVGRDGYELRLREGKAPHVRQRWVIAIAIQTKNPLTNILPIILNCVIGIIN